MSLQLNTTTSCLSISQSQLSFVPTEVGEEQFLLLKVGQDGVTEPVRVVAEAGYFQVAVQASPLRFSTDVTFIPAPGGTFLHVRYAPKQAGRHMGKLQIESDHGGQTVALEGRTMGLLTRVLPQAGRSSVGVGQVRTLPAPVPDSPTAGSRPWLNVAVAVALLGGGALAYWGLMRPAPTPQALPQTTQQPPVTAPAPVVISREQRAPKKTKPVNNEAVDEPVARRTPVARRERLTPTRTEPTNAELTQTELEPAATAPASRPERSQAEAPVARAASTRTPAEPAKKRVAPKPKPAETPAAESDLERELNKNQ
ncbi:hypothetical protein [Fibrella aquatilis]|uniref:Uncharacterized protein n=1 Tax=Fibrella aquatilis TaxID=2817059 RepID=A0A939G8E9_9BACT|nr:hypothetical protein [Fibrella aquatilis]MBO0932057.1 hypothetical protein [Fibrella aquatilis]